MQKTKLKILEICPFSAGICGVWTRVLSESQEFIKLGYEVRVFSSNIEKGTNNTACDEDNISGISIRRFKASKSLISKNVNIFSFEDELIKYNPDIVITHLLHPHSFKALKICLKNNAPCYLVTHAPFNVKRKFPLNLLTSIYNYINIKPKLNDFTKIITITKWELPYLLKLGVNPEKIAYIPNGLPEEYFKQKKMPHAKNKDVLFLGRIAPVKNVEVLLEAAKLLPCINFSIVGSAEEDYLTKLKKLIEKQNIKNIKFCQPIYDLSEKINLIDEHIIFALPSKREAMPQVLLEAMARGKIIIASATDGGKEIITNKKNGFLFEIGDYQRLAELIKINIKGNKIMQKNAERESKKYEWKKLIKFYPFIDKI